MLGGGGKETLKTIPQTRSIWGEGKRCFDTTWSTGCYENAVEEGETRVAPGPPCWADGEMGPVTLGRVAGPHAGMGPGWVSPALLCIPLPAAAPQELPRSGSRCENTARPGSAGGSRCCPGPSPTRNAALPSADPPQAPRGGTGTCGVGRNWNKRGFSGSWLTKRLSPGEREHLLPAMPGRLAIPDRKRKGGKFGLTQIRSFPQRGTV